MAHFTAACEVACRLTPEVSEKGLAESSDSSVWKPKEEDESTTALTLPSSGGGSSSKSSPAIRTPPAKHARSGSSGASTLKLNFSRAFAQAQADGERRLKQMQQRMSSPRKSDTAAMTAEPAPPAQPMLTSPAAAEDGEGAPEGLVSAFLEDTLPHGEQQQPQQETTLQPFDSYPGLDAVAYEEEEQQLQALDAAAAMKAQQESQGEEFTGALAKMLQDMGFEDEGLNRDVLASVNNDVPAAINILIGESGGDAPHAPSSAAESVKMERD